MSEDAARHYHRLRLTCFFLGIFLQAFLWVFLWRSGLSDRFLGLAGAVQNRVAEALLYFTLIFFYLAVAGFPLDFFSGHRLEKRFSLSRQSSGAWLADYAKKTLLSYAFFLLTAGAFFWAVRAFPGHWWWLLGLGSFLLSALLSALFPILLLPLFFPCRPLPEGELKKTLLEWCRSLRAPVLEIYEIAFSAKTVKANAALTGFGRTRRVLLADTLLQGFSTDEIKMVLAHEIGHQVRRHLPKGLLLDLVTSLGAFYLLQRLADAVAVASNARSISELRVLPVVCLLAFIATVLWMPIRNTLSRHYEREADRYAWNSFPSEEVFSSLMNRLAEKNLTPRSVDRWEEILLLDHPSVAQRLQNARHFFAGRPC